MPDWLREIQSSPETPGASGENPVSEPTAPTPVDELPDWLNAMDLAIPIEHESVASTSNPEPQETHPESQQELPQWLRDLKTLAPSESSITAPSSLESNPTPLGSEATVTQPSSIGDLPDLLSDLPVQSRTLGEIPPSESIPAAEPSTQVLMNNPQTTASPFIEIPEWLNELGKGQPITIPTSEEELTAAEVSSPFLQVESEPHSPGEARLPIENKIQPLLWWKVRWSNFQQLQSPPKQPSARFEFRWSS